MCGPQIILWGSPDDQLNVQHCFSLNSKQTNIQYKCIQGICTFIKVQFNDFQDIFKINFAKVSNITEERGKLCENSQSTSSLRGVVSLQFGHFHNIYLYSRVKLKTTYVCPSSRFNHFISTATVHQLSFFTLLKGHKTLKHFIC